LSTLDTKKKSASEALVNALGGYPIGYGLGIIILPLSWNATTADGGTLRIEYA